MGFAQSFTLQNSVQIGHSVLQTEICYLDTVCYRNCQRLILTKGLILSFLELESLRAWLYQEGPTPTIRKKTLKKKANLTELSQDAKKKINSFFNILMLSVCPFFFNSNKVYFASSLIAKPNGHADGPAEKF